LKKWGCLTYKFWKLIILRFFIIFFFILFFIFSNHNHSIIHIKLKHTKQAHNFAHFFFSFFNYFFAVFLFLIFFSMQIAITLFFNKCIIMFVPRLSHFLSSNYYFFLLFNSNCSAHVRVVHSFHIALANSNLNSHKKSAL